MELLTNVDKNEVLRYLGCTGNETDGVTEKRIGEMASLVKMTAEPKACHSVFKIRSHEPLLFFKTEAQFLGKDIMRHLADCSEAVFMAATLGRGVDMCLKRLEVTDMASAVVFDACASAAIENVCDNYSALLAESYLRQNLYLTARFSPGYGDLPLKSQRSMIDILQTEKRIGLFLNRSMMMEPVKSVTALIGVSENVQIKNSADCRECLNFEGCEFRRRGVTCHE